MNSRSRGGIRGASRGRRSRDWRKVAQGNTLPGSVALVLCLSTGLACGRGPTPEAEPQSAASVILGEIVTLRVGEQAEILAEQRLRLAFEAVLEDSRCPTEEVCVWEGNARIRVTLRAGEAESGPRELNTTAEPSSITFGEYSVHLDELTPHPRSDTPIPQGLYAARLHVTRHHGGPRVGD